ncbi:uncharacterized protein B0H18DRAFT_1213551 [Fomitopsis serialis]|uniref:uncharacterized protein n=1 Tax=Fomitopsis serialis TaxID=139415 RepID=UPI0020075677|nr:uncharacterized protein B0H18DRAFT_1213551 [Neoantrodia serialis]KAH9920072.1 hypothetical protein B0H18DRAFT_1213551 [Neoantrodia serialis]
MSAYNYVDTPNQNLVCCICRSAFVDPCTTRTCCHTFCYECIARAIAISAQCPVDRCSLSIRDLAPADPLIRNLVDELVVECPHKDEGCSHTCQRMLLPVHLKDSCKYVEVPCPDGKCSKGILRRDLASHTHAQDSSATGDAGRASEADFATQGSSQNSVESSGAGLVDNASISDGVSLASRKDTSSSHEAIEAENARLRLRLSAVEGVVNTLRFELQTVRRALGPWYSVEDSDQRRGWGSTLQHQGRTAGDPTSSTPLSVDPSAMSSIRDENASATSPSAPPQATSPVIPTTSELAARSDLSSYFPPAEDEDVYSPDFIRAHKLREQAPVNLAILLTLRRPTARISQARSAFLFAVSIASGGLSHPYPPHTFSPAAYPSVSAPPHPDPGVISIPPLDPSVPLPNTLASLHGSIASLAGALGALATTRAQDALYTGEELRSMRAGIHGVRMQLHDVLTAQVASRDTSTQPLNGSVGGTMSDSVGPGGVPLPGGLLHGRHMVLAPSEHLLSRICREALRSFERRIK